MEMVAVRAATGCARVLQMEYTLHDVRYVGGPLQGKRGGVCV